MPSIYEVPMDLDDVQGDIVPGFRKDYQDYLFLRFPAETVSSANGAAGPDPTRVRAWLADVTPSVASAKEVATFNELYRLLRARNKKHGGNGEVADFARSTWVNVAFTNIGLAALLGHDPWPAGTGTIAFKQGMFQQFRETKDPLQVLATCQLRDRVNPFLASLGSGLSIDESHQQAQVAHALVIVGADRRSELNIASAHQRSLARRHGLVEVAHYRGRTLGGGKEHFGFRDGISQPDPKQLLQGWKTDEQVVAPGEFIRGLPAEDGHQVREVLDWERNGSYLVFRRLKQNVAKFRAVVAGAATELSSPPVSMNGVTPDLFAAKCIGRLKDGTPLSQLPVVAGTTPSLDITASDFAQDQEGLKIPRFAHVRKLNPRDQNAFKSRYHRLIRRGIPYGPALRDGSRSRASDRDVRGLLFVGYLASIEDQFEFLLQNWADNLPFPPAPSGTEAGYDPIVGVVPNQPVDPNRPYAPRSVTYAAQAGGAGPIQRHAVNLDSFITLTGGGYFFAPSITRLRDLAGL